MSTCSYKITYTYPNDNGDSTTNDAPSFPCTIDEAVYPFADTVGIPNIVKSTPVICPSTPNITYNDGGVLSGTCSVISSPILPLSPSNQNPTNYNSKNHLLLFGGISLGVIIIIVVIVVLVKKR
jgi:hypothetical protein